jgi:hypothetical protein
MAEFAPFKNPVHPIDDTPLLQHAGANYKCSGCGEVGDWSGMQIYETVEEGMVIGLRVQGGPGATPVHACGSEASE